MDSAEHFLLNRCWSMFNLETEGWRYFLRMMSRHLCWSLLHVAVEIAGPLFSTLPLVTVTGHRPSTCSLIFPASIQPSICTSDYSALARQPSVLLPPPFTITMAQIDLMEVAEATAVESAILWQVQTILEALLPTGELDA